MESLVIHASNGNTIQGELLDLAGSSSLMVLEQTDSLGLARGSVYIEASGSVEHVDIFHGASCVTDTSISLPVVETPVAVVDQLMVADLADNGVEHNPMSILDASSRLNNIAADIHKAFAGELSLPEMQALVDQLQSDLLDFYAQSNDVFGELGEDISSASTQISSLDTDALLSSLQADQAGLSDWGHGALEPSLASGATLDALFAVPDHIPLTMDFSDSAHVESVAEFFNTEISSISSQAGTGSEDGGIDPSDLG